GVNDHLNIGDIWQCIQRHVLQRPDPSQSEHRHRGEDEKTVACANFNDSREHHMPPVAFTLICFVAMTCPFFWAEIVTCHVPPEPSEPVPSYTPPPLSVILLVVFIAAMPMAGIAAI